MLNARSGSSVVVAVFALFSSAVLVTTVHVAPGGVCHVPSPRRYVVLSAVPVPSDAADQRAGDSQREIDVL